MCKKVCALLMAMFVVFSALPTLAVQMEEMAGGKLVYDSVTYEMEKVYFDEFDDYTADALPEGYTASPTTKTEPAQDAEQGTVVKCTPIIDTAGGKEAADMELYKSVSSGLLDGAMYYATVKVKFSHTNRSGRLCTAWQSDGGTTVELFQVGSNGYFRTLDNVDLMPYEADTWYQLEMVVDTQAHTASLLVNGETLIDKAAIPEAFVRPNRLFAVKRFGNRASETVWVDDVGLYKLKASISDYDTRYTKTVNPDLSTDFEDGIPSNFIANAGSVETFDAAHGQSAKISVGGEGGPSTGEIYRNLGIEGDLMLFTEEVRFTTTNQTRPLLALTQAQDNNKGLEKYEVPALQAYNNGKFRFDGKDLFSYDTEHWYKIDLVLDLTAQTAQYFINGKAVTEKTALATKVGRITRTDLAKHWNGAADKPGAIYIDNFHMYTLTPKAIYPDPGYNAQRLAEWDRDYDLTPVVDETFGDETLGSGEKWTVTPSLTLEEKKPEFGNSLKLSTDPNLQGGLQAYFTLKEELTGQVAVSGSYWFGRNDQYRRVLAIRDQEGNNEQILLGIGNGGKLYGDLFKTELPYTYAAETWYDIMTVFDFDAGVYDIYLNDDKIVDGAALPDTVTGVYRVDILNLWDQTKAACHTYLDNVGIYQMQRRSLPKIGVTRYGKPVTAMSQLTRGDVIACDAPSDLTDGRVVAFALYQNDKLVQVRLGDSMALPKADLTGYCVKVLLLDSMTALTPGAVNAVLE